MSTGLAVGGGLLGGLFLGGIHNTKFLVFSLQKLVFFNSNFFAIFILFFIDFFL